MDNEFIPEQQVDEELYLYEEAIRKIDSFIRIAYEILSYESVVDSDRQDLELMTDLANTMEIQLLETMHKRNGNILFMDDEE